MEFLTGSINLLQEVRVVADTHKPITGRDGNNTSEGNGAFADNQALSGHVLAIVVHHIPSWSSGASAAYGDGSDDIAKS